MNYLTTYRPDVANAIARFYEILKILGLSFCDFLTSSKAIIPNKSVAHTSLACNYNFIPYIQHVPSLISEYGTCFFIFHRSNITHLKMENKTIRTVLTNRNNSIY